MIVQFPPFVLLVPKLDDQQQSGETLGSLQTIQPHNVKLGHRLFINFQAVNIPLFQHAQGGSGPKDEKHCE